MSPQTEFLELICKTVEENCVLSYEVSLEELDPEGGIYAELGSGFIDTTYFDKGTTRIMPVLFLSRDKDQKQGMEQLCSICNYLQRSKKYPQGKTVSWLDAKVATEPNKIGRDEDGKYNFSCIINCMIYF